MSTNKTHVVIVGGGFGGVKAALEISKFEDCQVTLVSDHDEFRYYPGLYHAATGGKRSGTHISLRHIFDDAHVKLVKATATTLDRAKKELRTKEGHTIAYDQLVLALGNVTNYFGIQGLPEYSYGIKTGDEVKRFKQHLHNQLSADGQPDLNYIVVGGGPTGIELAGALPAYLHQLMKNHGVHDRRVHVTIVEAMPHLLPRSPKLISRAVAKRLQQLGVKVLLGQAVQGETADALMVNGEPIKSHTVVWTAGVTNNPFFKVNNFKLTDRGKVEVDEYLQAEPDILVLGDNANTPFSGMAQTALHDAEFVAHNIRLVLDGHMPESYTTKQPVSVIPAGPGWAAVTWGKRNFVGRIGWILRSLADLVAFHNLESWPKAGEQWMLSMQDAEEDCPTCAHK
ncbi:MAG TPA: FAD-dependent oxidoreductase [Patescibacteria group bacterium]|nr:FAD-dependent oxidoreductase [Patescibacteria group bacterium]